MPALPSCLDANPLLHQIYASRGVTLIEELEKELERLAPFGLLANINSALDCLIEAIQLKHSIMIVGDFDADGATSTVLAVNFLQQLGANVSYLVPDRFKFGYGLSPEIVEVAAASNPNLIITVDNGISSFEGVLSAKKRGIRVLITDHHLPPSVLPEADAIVNPNLEGDSFPSKNLAGVGVIFYVMLALRARLRAEKWFEQSGYSEPNMAAFLDLVALGTVADVVSLDKNNRILVYQGLQRIKAGKVRPGIKALLEISGKNIKKIAASDLGFAVAPRLNAAGRLVDMRLGIECLLAISDDLAMKYAARLDALNKERQQLEEDMRKQALAHINNLQLSETLPVGVCLFDETWHQGIIGIIASRVKEVINRPVFAFASSTQEELKGSGRSISGLHLRDTLEKIATLHPGLVTKFGGHAMAAGMTLSRQNYPVFANLFNQMVSQSLSSEDLGGRIHSDGELSKEAISIETADILQKAGPWGQSFPEPVFDGEFTILSYQIIKNKHIKFLLSHLNDFSTIQAIAFNVDQKKMFINVNDKIQIVYRLNINEYNNKRNIQLVIDYFDPA